MAFAGKAQARSSQDQAAAAADKLSFPTARQPWACTDPWPLSAALQTRPAFQQSGSRNPSSKTCWTTASQAGSQSHMPPQAKQSTCNRCQLSCNSWYLFCQVSQPTGKRQCSQPQQTAQRQGGPHSQESEHIPPRLTHTPAGSLCWAVFEKGACISQAYGHWWSMP